MVDITSLVGVAGAPLVLALVSLVRESFPRLPTRYLPAVTLLLAIALNLGLAGELGTPAGIAVLVGIVTGLTASGLYSHAVTSAEQ